MDAPQTLHDFVLNLLVNADARSVFELDPEGALRAAGLADVTVADVQDVVPLVLDTLPLQGVASLDVLNEASCGGDTASGGPLDVVSQLTAVVRELNVNTQQSTTADVKAAALGVVGVDGTEIGAVSTLWSGIDTAIGGDGVTGPLVGDVAETLDADVLTPVTTEAAGLAGTINGVVSGVGETADAAVHHPLGDTVGGAVDGLLGNGVTGVVGGALGTVGHVVDALGVSGAVSGVATSAGDSVDPLGVGSVIGGVVDTVDGTIGSVGVDGVVGGVANTVDNVLNEGGVGGLTGALGQRVSTDTSADASGHGLLDNLL